MTPLTIPLKSGPLHKAAELIYMTGSKTDDELLVAVDFGRRTKADGPRQRLDKAISNGWFIRLLDGRIALSRFALDYLDEHPPSEAPVRYLGIAAAPRQIDVLNRPSLSRKYLLKPQGSRADVPAWSVRGNTTFHKG
jgi:hypothetical protein